MTAGSLEPEPPGEPRPFAGREQLPAGTLAGVRAEWTGFYDEHYVRTVRFLMRAGALQAAAEDAAQEAFLESWRLVNGDPGKWRAIASKNAWIRTVALRRCQRPPGPRRRPLETGSELPELPVPGPGHDELTAQMLQMLDLLRVLDPEARAVMAFTMDDVAVADIAAAMGIKPQRVRDVHKKARAALRRELARNVSFEGRKP